jgi:RNA polymerase sigma factor (sigma-70 family)
MGKFSEKEIIQGILNQDEDILRLAYRLYFPMVKFLVVQNNGKMEDAHDVFQEAMIVLYTRLRDSGFELNCTVKTYIFSICKNLWFQGLEQRGRDVSFDTYEKYIFTEETVVYDDRLEERRWLFQKHFLRLPKPCRKIIELFLSEYNFDEITKVMGYSSKNYTIKRKYECMKSLFSQIRNDPFFDEFK